MKSARPRLQAAVKFGFLLACFFTRQSVAQSDLQIMVNGPWDYVAHPGEDRVLLVGASPAKGLHVAYVFPGPDARHLLSDFSDAFPFDTNTATKPSIYYLDFDHDGNGDIVTNDEPASLYKPTQTVSPAKVSKLLGTTVDSQVPRYAISLPVPDAITTYTGTYGSGFTESKITVGPVTSATPPKSYTGWMVLHYSVSQIPKNIKLSLPGFTTPLLPIATATDGYRAGISILLMIPTSSPSSLRCDDASGMHFSGSMKLWGLYEHARFPVQNLLGQQPGYYDYDHCDEFHRLNLSATENRILGIRTATKALEDLRDYLLKLASMQGTKSEAKDSAAQDLLDAQKNLETIRENEDFVWPGGVPKQVACAIQCTEAFICKKLDANCHTTCQKRSGTCQAVDFSKEQDIEIQYAKVDKDDGGVVMETVGRSDCHKAQMNINGVLP